MLAKRKERARRCSNSTSLEKAKIDCEATSSMSTSDVLGADLAAGHREFGKKGKIDGKLGTQPRFQGYKAKQKGRFGGMKSEPGGFTRGYQAKGGSKAKLIFMLGLMLGGVCTMQLMVQSNSDKKKQIANQAADESSSATQ